MVSETGRPAETAGRLEKEIRVYDFLDRLEIAYQRVDHEPAMTMEACVEIDKTLDAPTCKNLLLCNRQKTNYYLLMMSGEKVFKTKELSAQLEVARLSFAPGEDMEAFLDITPGSLSVMGLMNDKDHRVQLVIDGPILEPEYIGFHPCINTSTLRVKTADLLDKILPAMQQKPIIVHLP